jgi:hypothetical protein
MGIFSEALFLFGECSEEERDAIEGFELEIGGVGDDWVSLVGGRGVGVS